VVIKSFSPQITGLDSPKPGTLIFHKILSLLFRSQVNGRFAPSSTPEEKYPL
jgi:hypothetical protein